MTDRKRKTPEQRAQEQFDVAARIAHRLTKQVTQARAELERLEEDWSAAVRRRDYLAKHPDLPKQKQSTTTSNSTGDTA